MRKSKVDIINILIVILIIIVAIFMVISILNKDIKDEELIESIINKSYSGDYEIISIEIDSIDKSKENYLVKIKKKLNYTDSLQVPFVKGMESEYKKNYRNNKDAEQIVSNIKDEIDDMIKHESLEYLEVEEKDGIYYAFVKGEKIPLEHINAYNRISSEEDGKDYLIKIINNEK